MKPCRLKAYAEHIEGKCKGWLNSKNEIADMCIYCPDRVNDKKVVQDGK